MERYWDSRCKICWSFVVATLLVCSSRVPATLAGTHPDFLNIDCGATDTYVDTVSGYTWVPDTAYISTGKLHSLVVPTSLQNFTDFKDLRYFDDLRPKNCFTLPVVSGSTYLLRATFFYGNYDNKNQPPSFQVALDANVMENVSTPSSDAATYVEYHYVAQGNESILCLLRTSEEETPFISGISLKPASALSKGYVKDYGQLLQDGLVMRTVIRVNYGETKVIRAPDDFYDRFWFPDPPYLKFYLSPTTSPMEFLSTTSPFPDFVNQDIFPPSSVMQTAVTSNGTLASVLFYPETPNNNNETSLLYVSVYFAELVQSKPGMLVPMNFTIDVLEAFFPVNLEVPPLTLWKYDFYNPRYTAGANDTMTMAPVAGALRGPILNAMEVFAVSDRRMTKTIKRDALAIEDIKKKLNMMEWTGDPCLPTPHFWVNCIPPDVTMPQPQITSMNLSGYHLEGPIPTSFANLLALTSLSLENNSLTGQLPEFLTTLTNLRVLSIQNNNFSGSIPKALLATNSSILFTYRPGNPLLVVSSESSKTKSSNDVAIVGATIGGILGVLLILVIAICANRRCKRNAPSLSNDEGASIMNIATPGAAKAYSRAEVNVATNNLNRELGRGGFGPVYYGILPDGTEVAVKVADKSSKQGEKEFFNEVDVLSRVHHKNLVALVGYCQEHDSILIYEYMPNGSLFDHLHGTVGKGSTLNWKSRLHIGLNAAQGLEYLHAGCCPSFIHRDVKSGNILLTLKFDAKVADFGLTRLMGEAEDTKVLTDVMGTAGYLDPEYYITQYLHTKSDVYSFGIVLLELITGRLPIDQSMTTMGKNPHIVHWVRESLQNNVMDSILAPAVKASNPNMGAVWKVVDIAMQSVEPKASHRPSMTEMVYELQGALTLEGGTIAGPEFHSGYADNCSTGPSSFPMPR